MIGLWLGCLRWETVEIINKCRGYSEKKVSDNVTCEIFQTCLEEARESYRPEIVWELKSNIVEQVDDNVAKIVSWLRERHS